MKNFNFSNWLMILLGVITIMCFCITPAFAEELGDDTEILDDAFGQRYQVTWVTASEFLPISSDTKYYLGSTGYMETRSYPMVYKAAIHLPSGAYFEGARFYFFDNDSNDSQSMVITRCTVFPQSPPNPTCKSLCSVGLNDSATPGWSSSFGNCTGGIDTIKNLDNTYQIEVWQAPSSLMSSLWCAEYGGGGKFPLLLPKRLFGMCPHFTGPLKQLKRSQLLELPQVVEEVNSVQIGR